MIYNAGIYSMMAWLTNTFLFSLNVTQCTSNCTLILSLNIWGLLKRFHLIFSLIT